MQMGAGGSAGLANSGDNISLSNEVPNFDFGVFEVGIHSLQAIAVVNNNHIAAVKKVSTAEGDDASGRGLDRRTFRCG